MEIDAVIRESIERGERRAQDPILRRPGRGAGSAEGGYPHFVWKKLIAENPSVHREMNG